ncbi:MAG: indole-3-glycerol phosphate synthase TrpC [Acidimicrobiia bacterium]|nr:indole-3-glycerol phosphate synthase TrpC [Acidimicrobiia bacterium]
MTLLDPILATTRQRLRRLPPEAELMRRCQDLPPARDFEAGLAAPGLRVIAEVKRRSPSRGVLAAGLDPVARARQYADGGAAAISVLTEPDHFDGSNDDLIAVRAAVDAPVLRKDFTLDVRQVWEARLIGADAVLLIVAALSLDQLVELHATAISAGLAALVEVHDEDEVTLALTAGARIVGVNNRDLTTFAVDLCVSERLAPTLAGVPVSVAESGILAPEDARRMRAAGFDAVLVGESLVRSGDPASAVRAFSS